MVRIIPSIRMSTDIRNIVAIRTLGLAQLTLVVGPDEVLLYLLPHTHDVADARSLQGVGPEGWQ